MARVRDFVAALRSGEYAQAKHQLRNSVGYCCEGVAFERYAEPLGYEIQIKESGVMIALGLVTGDEVTRFRSTSVAPPEFWRDMGLRNVEVHNVFVFELPGMCTIRNEDLRQWIEYAALNDAGFTFEQIADLIEWQFASCLAT